MPADKELVSKTPAHFFLNKSSNGRFRSRVCLCPWRIMPHWRQQRGTQSENISGLVIDFNHHSQQQLEPEPLDTQRQPSCYKPIGAQFASNGGVITQHRHQAHVSRFSVGVSVSVTSIIYKAATGGTSWINSMSKWWWCSEMMVMMLKLNCVSF